MTFEERYLEHQKNSRLATGLYGFRGYELGARLRGFPVGRGGAKVAPFGTRVFATHFADNELGISEEVTGA